MKMPKKILARILLCTFWTAFCALAFCPPAHGQFIGYTSPQTVQKQLLTAAPCQAAAQSVVVQNLGQSQHYALYSMTGGIASIQVVIEASMDGTTFFAISPVDSDQSSFLGLPSGGIVTASGYYPVVRVNLKTCTNPSVGGITINVFYSGTSVASGPLAGSLNPGAYYRVPLLNNVTPAGMGAVDVFSPTGNAGGRIYLQPFVANCPTVTITASFGPDANHLTSPATTLGTFVAPTVGVSSFITVAPAEVAFIRLGFSNGGGCGGGAVFDSSYQFTPISASGSVDPCQNSGVAKSSVAINISTATTTQLVAPSGTTAVYVCGFDFTISEVITTANTLLFNTGTAATCAGATVTKTGLYGAGGVLAAAPIHIERAGPGTVFSSAASSGVCAITAIGATGSFQGILTYVQQ